MRIMLRRERLAALLMVVLMLAGVGIRQPDAAVGVVPPLERLGFHLVGDQVAFVATRIPDWQELVEQRDAPLPRALWPLAAGVPPVLLLRSAAAWWLVAPPPSRGWCAPAHPVAGPRAPPRPASSA
jgi:hypothetical protein